MADKDISDEDLDYIESVFETIDIDQNGLISLSELASSKSCKIIQLYFNSLLKVWKGREILTVEILFLCSERRMPMVMVRY